VAAGPAGKASRTSLLGYPIVIAQDIPALAGSLSLWLGDWAEAYQVVDRIGIRTLRDPFTSKPYVIFYSTKRVGGGVLNFEAIKASSSSDRIIAMDSRASAALFFAFAKEIEA
jgi:HK97 family phage major capsid protein